MQLKDEDVVKIGITIWTIILLLSLILQIISAEYGKWTMASIFGIGLGFYGLHRIKKQR